MEATLSKTLLQGYGFCNLHSGACDVVFVHMLVEKACLRPCCVCTLSSFPASPVASTLSQALSHCNLMVSCFEPGPGDRRDVLWHAPHDHKRDAQDTMPCIACASSLAAGHGAVALKHSSFSPEHWRNSGNM